MAVTRPKLGWQWKRGLSCLVERILWIDLVCDHTKRSFEGFSPLTKGASSCTWKNPLVLVRIELAANKSRDKHVFTDLSNFLRSKHWEAMSLRWFPDVVQPYRSQIFSGRRTFGSLTPFKTPPLCCFSWNLKINAFGILTVILSSDRRNCLYVSARRLEVAELLSSHSFILYRNAFQRCHLKSRPVKHHDDEHQTEYAFAHFNSTCYQ